MTLKRLIEVLKIAEEINPGEYVCAEHDIIYVIEGSNLTDEQKERLEAAGAHLDSESGSWAAFCGGGWVRNKNLL